jgi:hypothetical protein
MSGIRLRGIALVAGMLLGSNIAFGQAPEQAPAAAGATPTAPESQPGPAPSTSTVSPDKKSMTITSGSTMTKWKWQEIRAKWVREKGKWADCRSQAKEQKLHGPKSWHFMADCMIKVAYPQPAADKSER